MTKSDEKFVGTCTHVDQPTADVPTRRRLAWLRKMEAKGLRTKVAFFDNRRMGFLHVMPAEIMPFGLHGERIAVIPCMHVLNAGRGLGIGKALVAAAEQEAKRQGHLALAVVAYRHDFWFMPAAFFENLGFKCIRCRKPIAILWKVFDSSKQPPKPKLLRESFSFKPVKDKVVVDIFWMSFCGANDLCIVEDVTQKYRDKVVTRSYCNDDRKIFCKYQIPRGIFINGTKTEWDYSDEETGFEKSLLGHLGKGE